jgi:Tfp pilus assembly protein PilO
MAKKAVDIKLLVLIGGVLILLGLIFGPVSTQTRTLVGQRKDLKEKLSTLEKKLSVLAGIDPFLIDTRVKKMEAVFPSKKPVVELLGTLSSLAEENELGFGGVSLKPGVLSGGEEGKQTKQTKKTTMPAGLSDLSFGFEVSGNYDKISGFMHELEKVAPLMKIDDVALKIKTNPLGEETAALLVEASIKVSAYFQPPPKTLGPVSTPVVLLSREQESLLNQLLSFKTYPVVYPTAQTGKQNLFSLIPLGE